MKRLRAADILVAAAITLALGSITAFTALAASQPAAFQSAITESCIDFASLPRGGVPGERVIHVTEDSFERDLNLQIAATATPTRTPSPINVGNFVWDDLDQDGRQDAGEPGLPGVTVQLWNSAKNNLIDSDITDANGIYSIQSPGPGSYRVRVVLPGINDEFSPKNQAGGSDLLDSDVNPSGVNFGFTDILNFADNLISTSTVDAGIIKFRTPTPTRTPTPVNFGNRVWDDLDQDGRQDAGEPGLAGVTVQLWNSTKTDLIDSDVTDANGIYTVQSPGPGAYRIRVVLPAFNDQFSPKDQAEGDDLLDSDINPIGTSLGFTDVYNVASNVISISSIDAGIIKYRTPTPTRTPTPINVGNFVWHDLNNNGIQDGGEPGLGGVVVQIWDAPRTTLYDTGVTNGNGNYSLTVPGSGAYRVRVLLPPGGSYAPENQGANDNLDSDINDSIVSLVYGFTDTYNFASNLISIVSIDAGIAGDPQVPTPTNTPTPTDTPTATQTPTPTDTPDPDWTATNTPEDPTPCPSATPTDTPTPTPTDEGGEVGAATDTPTPTVTLTPSITPHPTHTPTKVRPPHATPVPLTPTPTATDVPGEGTVPPSSTADPGGLQGTPPTSAPTHTSTPPNPTASTVSGDSSPTLTSTLTPVPTGQVLGESEAQTRTQQAKFASITPKAPATGSDGPVPGGRGMDLAYLLMGAAAIGVGTLLLAVGRRSR